MQGTKIYVYTALGLAMLVLLYIYTTPTATVTAIGKDEPGLTDAIRSLRQYMEQQNKQDQATAKVQLQQVMGDVTDILSTLERLNTKLDSLSQEVQDIKMNTNTKNTHDQDTTENYNQISHQLEEITKSLSSIQEITENGDSSNGLTKQLDDITQTLGVIEETTMSLSALSSNGERPTEEGLNATKQIGLPPLVEYQISPCGNVFFGLGARIGDSTLFFTGITSKAMGGHNETAQIRDIPLRIKGPWDIHMYEGHPKFDQRLLNVKSRVEKLDPNKYGGPFHVFCNNSTAIGWVDGVVDFFLDVKSKPVWGSSLVPNHNSNVSMPGSIIKVPIHNLSRLIMSYRISDYIIVKMDIEGIEYDIVSELAIAGALPFIDELYVEWHKFAETETNKGIRYHLIERAKPYMKVGDWN